MPKGNQFIHVVRFTCFISLNKEIRLLKEHKFRYKVYTSSTKWQILEFIRCVKFCQNAGNFKILGECIPKIREDVPNFRDGLSLDLVLLKQRLLELSPPVNIARARNN